MQAHLIASLPSMANVQAAVDEEARLVCRSNAKVLFREGAFVSRWVSPSIHEFLTKQLGLTSELAAESLISENTIDRKRGFAHATFRTAYPLRHPFRKSIGGSAKSVVESWFNSSRPLSTKHPDLCLLRPFPILFEAKYLFIESLQTARQELVKSVYEAYFYLGLSPIHDARPPWAYEYAVALIYDGSANAAISQAWQELSPEVRDSLWNAANVFVMVLRGRE
ncbi:MAG: hypothetical protein AB7U97_17130 [Pirellulales bacterium]